MNTKSSSDNSIGSAKPVQASKSLSTVKPDTQVASTSTASEESVGAVTRSKSSEKSLLGCKQLGSESSLTKFTISNRGRSRSSKPTLTNPGKKAPLSSVKSAQPLSIPPKPASPENVKVEPESPPFYGFNIEEWEHSGLPTPTVASVQERLSLIMAEENAHGYTEWRAEMQLLEGVCWLPVTKLQEWVRIAKRTNFSINESRMQTLERLNKLDAGESYFGQHKRFPERGFYVNTEFGDWDRKFQQVRNALCYKDPKGADKAHGENFNDALLSFSNGVMAIANQIATRDGLFDRTTFEHYYTLVWQ